MADEGTAVRVGAGLIRPYRPEDRAAVRAICCATAHRNRGSDTVFEDRELIADYWTAYYTDHEPESAFVVEENGRVVGYLLGCVDTKRQIRVMARQIVPRLVVRLLARLLTARYRKPQTYRMLRWWVVRSWREIPPIPLDRYPAHYHCNILKEGLRKRYYSQMALRFLDRIDKFGVPGLHGQVEEAAAGGVWTQMLAAGERPDLIEFQSEKPSTMLRDVLGDKRPMVNRAWGCSVASYRFFLSQLGDRVGI